MFYIKEKLFWRQMCVCVFSIFWAEPGRIESNEQTKQIQYSNVHNFGIYFSW